MTGADAEFTALYEQHHGRLVRWAAGRVGPDEAEDVAAKAMLAVWQHWDEVDDPVGYLYGAAKNSVLTEWKDRTRRPAAVADLPEIYSYCLDTDLDYGQRGTAATVALDWFQGGGSVATAVVAATLADGHSRARVAELTGLPKSEINKSVRQLREEYRQRAASQQAPDGVGQAAELSAGHALRRLPPRQREVFALNLLGLRPVHIASLLGIDGTDARVNLCYARKAIVRSTPSTASGPRSAETLTADVSLETLLELLPETGWKRDVVEVYSASDEWLAVLSWLDHMGIIQWREGDPDGRQADPMAGVIVEGPSEMELLASSLASSGLPAWETSRTLVRWGGYDQNHVVDAGARPNHSRYSAPDLDDAQLREPPAGLAQEYPINHGRPVREERRVRAYLVTVAKVLAVVRKGLRDPSVIDTHVGSPRYPTAQAPAARSSWLCAPQDPMGAKLETNQDGGLPSTSGYYCPTPSWTPAQRRTAASVRHRGARAEQQAHDEMPPARLLHIAEPRIAPPAELDADRLPACQWHMQAAA